MAIAERETEGKERSTRHGCEPQTTTVTTMYGEGYAATSRPRNHPLECCYIPTYQSTHPHPHILHTLPIYTFQQTTALDTHTHTPQDHNRHTYSISSEPSSPPSPVPDNAANQRCLLLKPHPYTQIHFQINEWVLHHLYDARWSTKIDSCFVFPMKISRLARFVVGAFSHGDWRDDRIDVVVFFLKDTF